MRAIRIVGLLCAGMAVCLVGAGNLFAQGTSGLTGVVTDQTGGVIQGAHATLSNPNTGYTQETDTNSVGVYQFLLVPPGDGYTLTLTKDSFRTYVVKGLYLGVGVTETHDAHLQVGQAAQSIEVTVKGEGTLNTTDASIGNVIEARAVQDLPIEIRMDASGLLGLWTGYLLAQLGTLSLTRALVLCGTAGVLSALAVLGVHRQLRSSATAFPTRTEIAPDPGARSGDEEP